MENNVSVIKQETYDVEEIKRKFLDKFLNTFNGIGYKPRGNKILLKPNFLGLFNESKPVTTKNEIIIAMIETLNYLGDYQIIISDSPAYSTIKKIAKNKGLIELLSKYNNVILREINSYKTVELGNNKIKVAKIIDEVDEIINLARFKTHSFQTLTCATKNLFGLVYKSEKQKQHLKNSSSSDFGEMLYLLSDYFKDKVSLNIIDCVVGMEGNGPSSGTRRRLGQIILSKDSISSDLVACKMINLDPNKVPYLKFAIEKQDVNYNLVDKIKVIRNFKLPKSSKTFSGMFYTFISLFKIVSNPFKKRFFNKKPYPNKECVGCGVCWEKCPTKAIYSKNNKAKIDYNKCIKCFVCHEVCPNHVIELRYFV